MMCLFKNNLFNIDRHNMVVTNETLPNKPSNKIIEACEKKGVDITEYKKLKVYKSTKKLSKQCDVPKKKFFKSKSEKIKRRRSQRSKRTKRSHHKRRKHRSTKILEPKVRKRSKLKVTKPEVHHLEAQKVTKPKVHHLEAQRVTKPVPVKPTVHQLEAQKVTKPTVHQLEAQRITKPGPSVPEVHQLEAQKVPVPVKPTVHQLEAQRITGPEVHQLEAQRITKPVPVKPTVHQLEAQRIVAPVPVKPTVHQLEAQRITGPSVPVPEVHQLEARRVAAPVPEVHQLEAQRIVAPVPEVHQLEARRVAAPVPEVHQLEARRVTEPVKSEESSTFDSQSVSGLLMDQPDRDDIDDIVEEIDNDCVDPKVVHILVKNFIYLITAEPEVRNRVKPIFMEDVRDHLERPVFDAQQRERMVHGVQREVPRYDNIRDDVNRINEILSRSRLPKDKSRKFLMELDSAINKFDEKLPIGKIDEVSDKFQKYIERPIIPKEEKKELKQRVERIVQEEPQEMSLLVNDLHKNRLENLERDQKRKINLEREPLEDLIKDYESQQKIMPDKFYAQEIQNLRKDLEEWTQQQSGPEPLTPKQRTRLAELELKEKKRQAKEHERQELMRLRNKEKELPKPLTPKQRTRLAELELKEKKRQAKEHERQELMRLRNKEKELKGLEDLELQKLKEQRKEQIRKELMAKKLKKLELDTQRKMQMRDHLAQKRKYRMEQKAQKRQALAERRMQQRELKSRERMASLERQKDRQLARKQRLLDQKIHRENLKKELDESRARTRSQKRSQREGLKLQRKAMKEESAFKRGLLATIGGIKETQREHEERRTKVMEDLKRENEKYRKQKMELYKRLADQQEQYQQEALEQQRRGQREEQRLYKAKGREDYKMMRAFNEEMKKKADRGLEFLQDYLRRNKPDDIYTEIPGIIREETSELVSKIDHLEKLIQENKDLISELGDGDTLSPSEASPLRPGSVGSWDTLSPSQASRLRPGSVGSWDTLSPSEASRLRPGSVGSWDTLSPSQASPLRQGSVDSWSTGQATDDLGSVTSAGDMERRRKKKEKKLKKLLEKYKEFEKKTVRQEQKDKKKSRKKLYETLSEASQVFDNQRKLLQTQEGILRDIVGNLNSKERKLSEWVKQMDENNRRRDRIIEDLIKEIVKLQEIEDTYQHHRNNQLSQIIPSPPQYQPPQPLPQTQQMTQYQPQPMVQYQTPQPPPQPYPQQPFPQYQSYPQPMQMPPMMPPMGGFSMYPPMGNDVYARMLADQLKDKENESLRAKLDALTKKVEEGLKEKGKASFDEKLKRELDRMYKRISTELTGTSGSGVDKKNKEELDDMAKQRVKTTGRELSGDLDRLSEFRRIREKVVSGPDKEKVDEEIKKVEEDVKKKTKKLEEEAEEAAKDTAGVLSTSDPTLDLIQKALLEISRKLDKNDSGGRGNIEINVSGAGPATQRGTSSNETSDSGEQMGEVMSALLSQLSSKNNVGSLSEEEMRAIRGLFRRKSGKKSTVPTKSEESEYSNLLKLIENQAKTTELVGDGSVSKIPDDILSSARKLGLTQGQLSYLIIDARTPGGGQPPTLRDLRSKVFASDKPLGSEKTLPILLEKINLGESTRLIDRFQEIEEENRRTMEQNLKLAQEEIAKGKIAAAQMRQTGRQGITEQYQRFNEWILRQNRETQGIYNITRETILTNFEEVKPFISEVESLDVVCLSNRPNCMPFVRKTFNSYIKLINGDTFTTTSMIMNQLIKYYDSISKKLDNFRLENASLLQVSSEREAIKRYKGFSKNQEKIKFAIMGYKNKLKILKQIADDYKFRTLKRTKLIKRLDEYVQQLTGSKGQGSTYAQKEDNADFIIKEMFKYPLPLSGNTNISQMVADINDFIEKLNVKDKIGYEEDDKDDDDLYALARFGRMKFGRPGDLTITDFLIKEQELQYILRLVQLDSDLVKSTLLSLSRAFYVNSRSVVNGLDDYSTNIMSIEFPERGSSLSQPELQQAKNAAIEAAKERLKDKVERSVTEVSVVHSYVVRYLPEFQKITDANTPPEEITQEPLLSKLSTGSTEKLIRAAEVDAIAERVVPWREAKSDPTKQEEREEIGQFLDNVPEDKLLDVAKAACCDHEKFVELVDSLELSTDPKKQREQRKLLRKLSSADDPKAAQFNESCEHADDDCEKEINKITEYQYQNDAVKREAQIERNILWEENNTIDSLKCNKQDEHDEKVRQYGELQRRAKEKLEELKLKDENSGKCGEYNQKMNELRTKYFQGLDQNDEIRKFLASLQDKNCSQIDPNETYDYSSLEQKAKELRQQIVDQIVQECKTKVQSLITEAIRVKNEIGNYTFTGQITSADPNAQQNIDNILNTELPKLITELDTKISNLVEANCDIDNTKDTIDKNSHDMYMGELDGYEGDIKDIEKSYNDYTVRITEIASGDQDVIGATNAINAITDIDGFKDPTFQTLMDNMKNKSKLDSIKDTYFAKLKSYIVTIPDLEGNQDIEDFNQKYKCIIDDYKSCKFEDILNNIDNIVDLYNRIDNLKTIYKEKLDRVTINDPDQYKIGVMKKFDEVMNKLLTDPNLPKIVRDFIEKSKYNIGTGTGTEKDLFDNTNKSEIEILVGEFSQKNTALQAPDVDLGVIFKLYQIYMQIVTTIIDNWENVNGIGKVIIKARPPIRNDVTNDTDKMEEFITSRNNVVKLSTCGSIIGKDPVFFGRFTNVLYMPQQNLGDPIEGTFQQLEPGGGMGLDYNDNTSNEKAFTADTDSGSISGSVVNMIAKKYNLLFLSYGLSGSGKTFTLVGEPDRDPKKGPAPLGITQLSMKEAIENININNYDINLKGIQYYNGKIYDCSMTGATYISKATIFDGKKEFTGTDKQIVGRTVMVPIPKISGGGTIASIVSNINTKLDTLNPVSTTTINGALQQLEPLLKVFGDPNNNTMFDVNNAPRRIGFISDFNIIGKLYVKPSIAQFRDWFIEFIKELTKKGADSSGPINGGIEEIKKIVSLIGDVVKLKNVSEYEFDMSKIDQHKIDSDDVFEDATPIQINGTNANEVIKNFNQKFVEVIVKNRLTRSTANNPDSSRSHLFAKIEFQNKTDLNDNFNLYISDLAGAEDPAEFLGEARIEGYWVLLSLKQIQVIMKEYSQYEYDNLKPDLVEGYVLGTDKKNQGIAEFLKDYNTPDLSWKDKGLSFVPIEYVKIYKDSAKTQLDQTNTKEMIKGIIDSIGKYSQDNGLLSKSEDDTGKAIYDTFNTILQWSKINSNASDAKINKVITFINVRQFMPLGSGNENKKKTICQATYDSLVYGQSIINKDMAIQNPDGTYKTNFTQFFGRRRVRSYHKYGKPRKAQKGRSKNKKKRRRSKASKKRKSRRQRIRSNKKDDENAVLVVSTTTERAFQPTRLRSRGALRKTRTRKIKPFRSNAKTKAIRRKSKEDKKDKPRPTKQTRNKRRSLVL